MRQDLRDGLHPQLHRQRLSSSTDSWAPSSGRPGSSCPEKGFPVYAPLESVGLTLRATTRTPDTETPWPDPGTAPIEELRGWIHDLHTRDHALIEAPAVASPSLVRQLDAIVGADAVAAKKVRLAAVSLMRYLLRYGGRPTPYGLFAGVAPLTLGGRTRV